MFEFFKKSLRNRLLVSFVLVGFLPFVILLSYTLFLSETKIVNKTIQDQFSRAKNVQNLIKNHLKRISKEVQFISTLDIMDDIVAEDIDKRISILLRKKRDDFDLDISLCIVNNENRIIASSSNKHYLEEFTFQNSLQKGEFIVGSWLYITSKIYASFDQNQELGYLVLRYNLKNLQQYLFSNQDMHSYITNQDYSVIVGEIPPEKIDLNRDQASIITDKELIVYKRFEGILRNYYLVYEASKEEALKFLYDFIRFMLYISPVILLLIIILALRYSKNIVKPVEQLTLLTDTITKKQDYSTVIEVESEDEIATLADSFNAMLKTTSKALHSLEEENKLRLKRFVQLIDVFNTIIQTSSEEECIEVSIDAIKEITKRDDLSFSKQKTKNSIDLYVTDFEDNTKIYFGSISLSIERFSDENEKSFYTSIASMIMLQLDRIRLIKRTMAASKAKSAFISNMSHELRTPLNAIIGFSQFLITYEELTEDQQDTVANIESSAQYLLGMINEILDIAKIEAGKMETHKEYVDISQLLESVYSMLKPLADEKNIDLSLIIKEDIGDVFTDPKMFQQIVTNLVSNSIKFTQEGYVKIELFKDKRELCVEVSDSGIGIDPKDLQELFSDFTQVENVMQKKHKGTGLGLSLSKKMAHIIGGDITLESEGIGNGTRALFCIVIDDEV